VRSLLAHASTPWRPAARHDGRRQGGGPGPLGRAWCAGPRRQASVRAKAPAPDGIRSRAIPVRLRGREWSRSVLGLPADSLAFTYCFTPVCYELADFASVVVERAAGASELIDGAELPLVARESVFARDGLVERLIVRVSREAFPPVDPGPPGRHIACRTEPSRLTPSRSMSCANACSLSAGWHTM
jgi:hypothetical protein